ncbi:hypothetical protein NPIL_54941 [Nephila pilipes]|uniref:Uncharacterized protein n=1 Tax=Nephila pilipes TaxID=299642 RepID=A0A8X6UBD6_NEPPI|nr:hypothetical protein NPIL_54941 [Nephila pilipes]
MYCGLLNDMFRHGTRCSATRGKRTTTINACSEGCKSHLKFGRVPRNHLRIAESFSCLVAAPVYFCHSRGGRKSASPRRQQDYKPVLSAYL